MAYEYIKRAYRLTFNVGDRVRHIVTGRDGSVRRESRSQGHYVMVRFDGQHFNVPCHPEELVPTGDPS